MTTIREQANKLHIKRLFGTEKKLQEWLKKNPMFYIINIEYFQYKNKYNDYTEGFFIYYKKS